MVTFPNDILLLPFVRFDLIVDKVHWQTLVLYNKSYYKFHAGLHNSVDTTDSTNALSYLADVTCSNA